MKKTIKRVGVTLLILILIYAIGRLGVVLYGSYVFTPRAPYLLMQTKNSITLKWQTPESEVGSLHYGLTAHTLLHEIKENKTTQKHRLVIQNLQECTRYFYSVDSSSLKIDNKERSFTTLCENKEMQRIWIIGDSGDGTQGQKDVYNSMLNYIKHDFFKLDMWLLLGDNAYTSGTQKQYNKTLFEPYKELIKKFVPWAVIGNHDARRWAFYDIWEFPQKAESGGVASASEQYYSIDNANLHLVMLDSETQNLAKNGDMAEWLKKDLRKNTKPWVVVAFHTPPYTDGGHKSDNSYNSGGRMTKMRENFVPIFDEFGVDLVLSGHSHGYERSKLMKNHLGLSKTFSEKNIVQDAKENYKKSLKEKKDSGTIYLVCGSSAKIDVASLKHPAMPYSFEKLGSLILEITPNTLTSKLLTIDGTIADKFTIHKERP